MSRETMQDLNRNVLVGMTDERGHAWHYRQGMQGNEPNHYPRHIPVADVNRRLFSLGLRPAPVAVLVPATVADATDIADDGSPVKWAVQTDRKAIVRSDTGAVLGMFKDGYQIHDYREWLIGVTSNILGDTVGITSAGLLKGGAVAWVEIGVPETMSVGGTGVFYRPNLLAATSCDGSLATTFKRTVTNTVCDNTMAAALRENGGEYRVKHTRNSGLRIGDARAALLILEQTADKFDRQVHELVETTVTDRQWSAFLDAYVPTTKDGQPITGKSLTMANNKRDTLSRLWIRDERVSPWKGTAWGVVQAVNTYGQHEQIVRGAPRDERNMLNALDGTTFDADVAAMALLDRILTR